MKKTSIIKVVQITTLVLSLVIIMTPMLVLAQSGRGFQVPSGSGSNLPTDTSISDLIMRIINIALGLAGLVAVLFLIVGGFRYITAAGNEENSEAAKKIIINAIIGIVVIILSFVIVRVISNALISGQA